MITPFPPDIIHILVVGFFIFGFFGVAYLRGNSLKSKIIYLFLLFLVLVCIVGIWLALGSVTITTDLQIYSEKRPVEVLMGVFSRPYIGGTFIYQSGPYPMQKKSGFTFYKLNGSIWEELNTECPDCAFVDCVDGKPIERYNFQERGECRQVTETIYRWNQTIYSPKLISCGGREYMTHVEKHVGPGRYRVEFCYGKAFNFDWSMPLCTPIQNLEPTCVQSEFVIR